MSESELSASVTDAQINTAFTILVARERQVARGKTLAWEHNLQHRYDALTDAEREEYDNDKRWEHMSSRVGSLQLAFQPEKDED